MKFKDKTRGGYALTIYNPDAGGHRPVHAMIVVDGHPLVTDWPASGRYCMGGQHHAYDLLPLREPSEAAVEAAVSVWFRSPESLSDTMPAMLAAAYEIDFPEGGK